MMTPDIDKVSEILKAAADEEILPRFQSLNEDEIQSKDSGELVTVADVASERFITARLRDLLPGSLVVGEEAVDADPSLLERLDGEEAVWLIDPIDGTGNFARGHPVFAVMVALVKRGETIGAWIYDPNENRCATAEKGGGAWMDRTRLNVAESAGVLEMQGTLHASSFAPPEMAKQVQSRREKVGAIKSLRCAGWEYLRLVQGDTHFSLFTRLMPWDHAPGVLIHSEAGGVGWCFDRTPYGPKRYREHGVLMAPDVDSWHALHSTLFG